MVGELESAGVEFVGTDETGDRMEVTKHDAAMHNLSRSVLLAVQHGDLTACWTLNFLQILELPWHPYFVGVQFHPEFRSRPGKPSPLFTGKR